MEIISGLIMGLLGSFHCLGMCGPIVMAVPHRTDNKLSITLDSILYNFGRTITYTFLGFLVGLIGSSISLAGYQETISIFSGIALLIIVLIPKKINNRISEVKIIKLISNKFKIVFGNILKANSIHSLFILGLLNGLLPCGLVYIALTASIASGTVIGSMTFMFFFGLGTIPMMASVFILKSWVSVGIRRKINRLIPVGVTIVALLLILRGLALGIPYVSPKLPNQVNQKMEHHMQ